MDGGVVHTSAECWEGAKMVLNFGLIARVACLATAGSG